MCACFFKDSTVLAQNIYLVLVYRVTQQKKTWQFRFCSHYLDQWSDLTKISACIMNKRREYYETKFLDLLGKQQQMNNVSHTRLQERHRQLKCCLLTVILYQFSVSIRKWFEFLCVSRQRRGQGAVRLSGYTKFCLVFCCTINIVKQKHYYKTQKKCMSESKLLKNTIAHLWLQLVDWYFVLEQQLYQDTKNNTNYWIEGMHKVRNVKTPQSLHWCWPEQF